RIECRELDRLGCECEALILPTVRGLSFFGWGLMLVSVGMSHKRASLATLDDLTLRDLSEFYADLHAILAITELVVFQPFNRFEILLVTKPSPHPVHILR